MTKLGPTTVTNVTVLEAGSIQQTTKGLYSVHVPAAWVADDVLDVTFKYSAAPTLTQTISYVRSVLGPSTHHRLGQKVRPVSVKITDESIPIDETTIADYTKLMQTGLQVLGHQNVRSFVYRFDYNIVQSLYKINSYNFDIMSKMPDFTLTIDSNSLIELIKEFISPHKSLLASYKKLGCTHHIGDILNRLNITDEESFIVNIATRLIQGPVNGVWTNREEVLQFAFKRRYNTFQRQLKTMTDNLASFKYANNIYAHSDLSYTFDIYNLRKLNIATCKLGSRVYLFTSPAKLAVYLMLTEQVIVETLLDRTLFRFSEDMEGAPYAHSFDDNAFVELDSLGDIPKDILRYALKGCKYPAPGYIIEMVPGESGSNVSV